MGKCLGKMFLCFFLFLGVLGGAEALGAPLSELRDITLSFFGPFEGTAAKVEGKTVYSDIGPERAIKTGMRMSVLRKGEFFLHPLTKEPIGRMETQVGAADVVEALDGGLRLEVVRGDVLAGDVLRVSAARVRALFYQTEEVDWNLSEEYFGMLSETGRFEFVHTELKHADMEDLIEEAKREGAPLLIFVSQEDRGEKTALIQRLFWSSDSKGFAENEVLLEKSLIKDMKFGEEFFGPSTDEARVSFNIPFGVTLLAVGDLDGDEKRELALSTGRDLRFYSVGASLMPALDGVEIKGERGAEHISLHIFDIDGDGKGEVILTSMQDGKAASYVYGYSDGAFHTVWKGDFFVRLVGSELYGQKYQSGRGYEGDVFPIVWGGAERGARGTLGPLALPDGVNIYDFALFPAGDGGRALLAYDEAGFLNLYDENGRRLWRSPEDYGGAVKIFKRESPTVMVDAGFWSVKDRLIVREGVVFALKRFPLVGQAKSIGYKTSELRALRWTGGSVEDEAVVRDISGKAIDFQVLGENVFVLASPLFGFEAMKILKGENPVVNKLYIYPLKVK